MKSNFGSISNSTRSGGYINSAILLLILYTFFDIRKRNTMMAVSYYSKLVLVAAGVVGALTIFTFIYS